MEDGRRLTNGGVGKPALVMEKASITALATSSLAPQGQYFFEGSQLFCLFVLCVVQRLCAVFNVNDKC